MGDVVRVFIVFRESRFTGSRICEYNATLRALIQSKAFPADGMVSANEEVLKVSVFTNGTHL